MIARFAAAARAAWNAPLLDPAARTINLLSRDAVLTLAAAPFVWGLLVLIMAALP